MDCATHRRAAPGLDTWCSPMAARRPGDLTAACRDLEGSARRVARPEADADTQNGPRIHENDQLEGSSRSCDAGSLSRPARTRGPSGAGAVRRRAPSGDDVEPRSRRSRSKARARLAVRSISVSEPSPRGRNGASDPGQRRAQRKEPHHRGSQRSRYPSQAGWRTKHVRLRLPGP